MKKRLPSEWEQLIGIEVIDPDGWDRKNPHHWEIPLTAAEFLDKCDSSTIRYVTE
jgi:hypothetical protein